MWFSTLVSMTCKDSLNFPDEQTSIMILLKKKNHRYSFIFKGSIRLLLWGKNYLSSLIEENCTYH